jgi:glycosyltransferase involved in cell wall biosynthesis
VRKVLFIISRLSYSGAARQAMLLAAHLPRDRFEVRLVVIGGTTPWAEELRAGGTAVDVLGRQRSVDVLPFLRLRSLVREHRPDVVHVWGTEALRAIRLLPGTSGHCRTFASAVLSPGRRAAWLDQFILRRAVEIIAFGEAENRLYSAIGLKDDRAHRVRPAVVVATCPTAPASLPIPPGHLALVLLGPLTPEKGCRDAVWALDILRKVRDDLHLIVVGEGPDRARTQKFAAAIHVLPWVRFIGNVPDVWPYLEAADMFWAPTLADCGRCGTLEAMAAGLPVVATRWPGLEEIVVEEETGLLVPPGDRAALARQARRLVDDASLRRRLGEAGRRRAEEHSIASLVEACARLYHS